MAGSRGLGVGRRIRRHFLVRLSRICKNEQFCFGFQARAWRHPETRSESRKGLRGLAAGQLRGHFHERWRGKAEVLLRSQSVRSPLPCGTRKTVNASFESITKEKWLLCVIHRWHNEATFSHEWRHSKCFYKFNGVGLQCRGLVFVPCRLSWRPYDPSSSTRSTWKTAATWKTTRTPTKSAMTWKSFCANAWRSSSEKRNGIVARTSRRSRWCDCGSSLAMSSRWTRSSLGRSFSGVWPIPRTSSSRWSPSRTRRTISAWRGPIPRWSHWSCWTPRPSRTLSRTISRNMRIIFCSCSTRDSSQNRCDSSSTMWGQIGLRSSPSKSPFTLTIFSLHFQHIQTSFLNTLHIQHIFSFFFLLFCIFQVVFFCFFSLQFSLHFFPLFFCIFNFFLKGGVSSFYFFLKFIWGIFSRRYSWFSAFFPSFFPHFFPLFFCIFNFFLKGGVSYFFLKFIWGIFFRRHFLKLYSILGF